MVDILHEYENKILLLELKLFSVTDVGNIFSIIKQ